MGENGFSVWVSPVIDLPLIEANSWLIRVIHGVLETLSQCFHVAMSFLMCVLLLAVRFVHKLVISCIPPHYWVHWSNVVHRLELITDRQRSSKALIIKLRWQILLESWLNFQEFCELIILLILSLQNSINVFCTLLVFWFHTYAQVAVCAGLVSQFRVDGVAPEWWLAVRVSAVFVRS